MNTINLDRRQERGSVIIMGAFALLAVIAVSGLAIDSGRYFAVRAELAKAVDAGALAGARVLASGPSRAEAAAQEYAEMNFTSDYMSTTSHGFSSTIDPDPASAKIAVRGTAAMPTTFLRVLGLTTVTVRAFAEAERPPLSVALVLDNSGSLDRSFAGIDAIGYLRTAAGEFIGYFSDDMDQMSLTLFSTGTENHFSLGHNFASSIGTTITGMQAVANTNLSDGLLDGYQQLRSDQNPASIQCIVFFTDGRPTALRDVFMVNGNPIDGVIAGDQNPGGNVAGQLYRPDRIDQRINGANYTANTFPNGLARTVVNLQSTANQNLLTAAALARSQDITIYTIGLGNPIQPEVWKQPDAALLIQVANAPEGIDPRTGGMLQNPNYNSNQPTGAFYFAPDATELSNVFEQVARDIVLRLTQ